MIVVAELAVQPSLHIPTNHSVLGERRGRGLQRGGDHNRIPPHIGGGKGSDAFMGHAVHRNRQPAQAGIQATRSRIMLRMQAALLPGGGARQKQGGQPQELSIPADAFAEPLGERFTRNVRPSSTPDNERRRRGGDERGSGVGEASRPS